MRSENLAGHRILVVEDETSIAVLIEELLLGLGCVVIGPVAKLAAAMQLAREAEIDAAILDVHVRGGEIFPAAELLMSRNIPFMLASGFDQQDLPPWLRGGAVSDQAVHLSGDRGGSRVALSRAAKKT